MNGAKWLLSDIWASIDGGKTWTLSTGQSRNFLSDIRQHRIMDPSKEPTMFWDKFLAGMQLRSSAKFFSQVFDYPESLGVDSKLQLLKLTQNLVNVINQARCLRKN